MIVKNTFPTLEAPYRIALIGEAPGRDEELSGVPFIGASGSLLRGLAASVHILPQACFIGNICQHRPPNNEIASFSWNGEEIQSGLSILKKDLDMFNPNICVLLGNTALRAAFTKEKASVSSYRGTLFISDREGPFYGRKCISSYHPASCLRSFDQVPILRFDLKRAAEEGRTPHLELPIRKLVTPADFPDRPTCLSYLLDQLSQIVENSTTVSIDIEGGINSLSAISFSTDPLLAFVVPFVGAGGGSFWDEDSECLLWRAVARVLTNHNVPKILQNSLYDNFVLSYSYQIPVLNVADDTMLKHWEAFSELEKNLGFQASIYTKEPFWKDERENPDLLTFWRYNAKDSAVTYEICRALDREVRTVEAKNHYRFNMSMLRPILYMELRGIRYDSNRAATRRSRLLLEVEAEQLKLDCVAGHPVNVGSPKQCGEFFYDELGLPEQFNRKTGARTTNYEALLSLAKKTNHPALLIAIRLRSLSTHERMLRISADDDGRIRCGYNVVGTETGRLTCYTSPTGSGYNLQTIPESDRDLFVADPDCYIFQCDLSGADGWTVAAHCAACGDTTMLDDLLYGIKIAKVIACMFKHGPQISRLPREELKKLTDTIAKNDPLYFGSKCCQHGTNYGMGKILLSATIFIQSEGTVNISAADADRLQYLYMTRYWGVKKWQDKVMQKLRKDGALTTASGHKRIFFGRREDHATFKSALSNEPQENTTYATNLAALNLWRDPENRRADNSLQVEPLHQVHDALVGQFRQDDVEFAVRKINHWFNNTLTIAGLPIRIPFEGRYGDSWGNLPHKI